MHSPYFQTEHYKEETLGGQYEQKIENTINKLKYKILTLFKK